MRRTRLSKKISKARPSRMKRELTPADVPLASAPKGFTGKIKYVSMMPSGMQFVIIGKGDKPSLRDRKFYIENQGVRLLAAMTDNFRYEGDVTIFTGKESWEKNLVTNIKLPDED